MKKILVLMLINCFSFAGVNAQSTGKSTTQTATFKDAASILLTANGKTTSVFYLTVSASTQEKEAANQWAKDNNIQIVEKNTKLGVKYELIFPSSQFTAASLAKFLYQIGVQQVVVTADSTTPITIEEFINKY